MSKHTPGPWTLETVKTSIGTCHKIGPFPSHGVYSEAHACVYADGVHAHNIGHDKIGDELLANANLIKAAPDLLDALEFIVTNSASGSVNRLHPADDKRARAAIAKARGVS